VASVKIKIARVENRRTPSPLPPPPPQKKIKNPYRKLDSVKNSCRGSEGEIKFLQAEEVNFNVAYGLHLEILLDILQHVSGAV